MPRRSTASWIISMIHMFCWECSSTVVRDARTWPNFRLSLTSSVWTVIEGPKCTKSLNLKSIVYPQCNLWGPSLLNYKHRGLLRIKTHFDYFISLPTGHFNFSLFFSLAALQFLSPIQNPRIQITERVGCKLHWYQRRHLVSFFLTILFHIL